MRNKQDVKNIHHKKEGDKGNGQQCSREQRDDLYGFQTEKLLMSLRQDSTLVVCFLCGAQCLVNEILGMWLSSLSAANPT